MSAAVPAPTAPAAASERTTIFSRSLIRERVKIVPKELGSNVREIILVKLQGKFEGRCSRHGLIKPGSLKLHTVSPGRLEGASLNGDVAFNVTFTADVCNPMPGHVVPARVVNTNKFGLLAHSCMPSDVEGGEPVVILEIVITRHNYHGKFADVPLESVRVGDDVFVEVLGKTFELNDTKISIAGRLMRATPSGGQARRQQSLVSSAVIGHDMLLIEEDAASESADDDAHDLEVVDGVASGQEDDDDAASSQTLSTADGEGDESEPDDDVDGDGEEDGEDAADVESRPEGDSEDAVDDEGEDGVDDDDFDEVDANDDGFNSADPDEDPEEEEAIVKKKARGKGR